MMISEIKNINKDDVFLDWKDRPKSVSNRIDQVFKLLSHRENSEWLYNGKHQYKMLYINEHILAKKIISENSQKKEFYFLDIGAGNFQWGRKLNKYLNAQKDLPRDIKVHVIGIRGEGGVESIRENGICKIYELTAFKVETLINEFKERGLPFENSFDLVISSWCFRHLVDPLGTFQQTYDLLRPKTGVLIMDGFFFMDHEDTLDEYLKDNSYKPHEYLISLLHQSKAPFLVNTNNSSDCLWQFLIKRHSEEPCRLPIKYSGIEIDDKTRRHHQVGSGAITRFKMIEKRLNFKGLFEDKMWKAQSFFGDEKIYKYLLDNGHIYYLSKRINRTDCFKNIDTDEEDIPKQKM